MSYADYAPLVDSGLVLALAFIVWAAYRELRRRKSAADMPSSLSKTAS